jgi:Sec-independent protein translocase protein TatA
MEILGIGPLEFGLILVLMFVLLGPGGMVRIGQQVGSFIKNLVKSDSWRAIVNSSREIRQAQDKFMKESGIREGLEELRDTNKSLRSFDPDPFKSRQIQDPTRIPQTGTEPVVPPQTEPKSDESKPEKE